MLVGQGREPLRDGKKGAVVAWKGACRNRRNGCCVGSVIGVLRRVVLVLLVVYARCSRGQW